jgi:hypothetical protein
VYKSSLQLEILEIRALPASIYPVQAIGSNVTLDQAQSLGDLTVAGQARVQGTIGDGSGTDGQVNWYSFTLDAPAQVSLATFDQQTGNPLVSVVSLYNTDTDNTNDPFVPSGWRLLAQDDGAGHGGDASIVRSLSANTYFVAVSGSGDRYFHPSIANSGYPGKTGDYDLRITAQDLGLAVPPDGPVVLATDLLSPIDPVTATPSPGVNAEISRSPLLIRLDFSEPIDPSTIQPGVNLQLLFSPDGDFSSSLVQSVTVNPYFDASANELKLGLSQPLGPGFYEVLLTGDGSSGAPVLMDLSGNALGQDANHPTGQDYTFTFHISGADGNPAAAAADDQTPSGANELGDITQAGIVQAAGVIGDDSLDPVPFNPADIDLYHFRITGPGRFAFQTEVFAGRVGSPLDSEVSLFRLDPTDNQLPLIALNNDTTNNTKTFDGTQTPLYTDSSLFAGLTEGDYYIAVTGAGYVPALLSQDLPTPNSVFDPTVSHLEGGSSIGDYVLNLYVQPDNVPPQVLSVQLADGSALTDGAVLPSPPTGLAVKTSEPVNLTELDQEAVLRTNQNIVNAVFISGPQGVFYPRFSSYTDTDNATFLMYDALPNGAYQLHLSGRQGLTDLAGNPLVGNDFWGDYVIRFTVNSPPRGSSTDPLTWFVQGQQDLGVLFPNELAKGVHLVHSPLAGGTSQPPGSVDSLQIQLLQKKPYIFLLTSTSLPRTLTLKVLDDLGNPLRCVPRRILGGIKLVEVLAPGTYTILVQGWSPAAGYTLTVSIAQAMEPIPPLTVGPRPSIRIRHTEVSPPPASSDSAPPPALPVALNLPALTSTTLTVSLVTSSGSTANSPTLTLSDIPSGIFLALGPGPIGGLNTDKSTAASSSGQSFVQVPGLLLPEALVQLPILLQLQGSGTELGASSSGGFGSLLRDLVSKLDKLSWSRIVELLYRFQDHLTPAKAVTPPNDLAPETPEQFEEELDVPEAEFGLWDRAGSENEGQGKGEALVLAAALAVLSPRRRTSRRESRRDNPAFLSHGSGSSPL